MLPAFVSGDKNATAPVQVTLKKADVPDFTTMRHSFLRAFKCEPTNTAAIVYKMWSTGPKHPFAEAPHFDDLMEKIATKEKKQKPAYSEVVRIWLQSKVCHLQHFFGYTSQ